MGCLARVPRDAIRRELLHLILVPSEDPAEGSTVVVDALGRSNSTLGKGAWVHARRDCLQKAAQKGLARAAKGRVVADVNVLAEQIAAQADQRIEGLFVSARRARALAIGGTAVAEALEQGAPLVLVAADAAAAAKLGAVQSAQRDGLAVAWGNKARLGAVCGRGAVGVTAVLDPGIADALRHALGLLETFSGGPFRG